MATSDKTTGSLTKPRNPSRCNEKPTLLNAESTWNALQATGQTSMFARDAA